MDNLPEVHARNIRRRLQNRFGMIHVFVAWVFLGFADLLSKTMTMIILPFRDGAKSIPSGIQGFF